jgi:GcrA cell cycle regulator
MTAIGISSENSHLTWTTERVVLLKNYVNAGLSCAQIAQEIGVSRNAVIGKINRLGLSRGRSAVTSRPREGASTRTPRVLTQRRALQALFASEPVVEDVVSAEPCSLLDLGPGKCRWPIGGVGISNFTFCGNTTAAGSYCAGHARKAYRLSGPARSGRLASVVTATHTSVPTAHPPVASEGIEQFRRTSAQN